MTDQRCPRCEGEQSRRPAVSRADNKTGVCADCGMDEAVYGVVPIPSWPIPRAAMVIRLQEWQGEGIGTRMSVGEFLSQTEPESDED